MVGSECGCSALWPRLPFAARGSDTSIIKGESSARSPLALQDRFCAAMLDTTLDGTTPVPSLTFQYTLCIDTKASSYKRVDPGSEYHPKGELIFNGTNLIAIGRKGCHIGPKEGGDPTKGLPFTLLVIDEEAAMLGPGEVDGRPVTVWHHHRKASPAGDKAQDVYWYVNAKNELVRRTASIQQPSGLNATVVRQDFFARGNYTNTIPSDAFATPAGMSCK